MTENKELSFEEKEKRLDAIVGKLESDKNLTLKQTTELYAEGKKLIASLDAELQSLKELATHEIVADK